ncbi:MAG: penicillin acylase family protein [Myxococcota bacterium]
MREIDGDHYSLVVEPHVDGLAHALDAAVALGRREAGAAAGLLGAAVLALVVAVGAGGAGIWRVRHPWPQTSGRLALPGLHGEVTVWRDARGVPSVSATDAHDLFFAQGYVHAQDRLWQMQLGRSFARGELGALFGEAALDADRMVLTYGLPQAAEATAAHLDPDTRAVLEAYAEGVNAYLDGHPGAALPVEFAVLGVTPDAWRVTDSLLVGESIALALGQNASTEVLRARLEARLGHEAADALLPDAPSRFPPVVPTLPPTEPADEAAPDGALPFAPRPGDRSAGSNAFVVSGSRTASGRALLANDTHLALGAPSVWYQNALYGGGFAVTGFSLPGAPLVVIGHNDDVAWGMTSLVSDAQDLYLERLDAPDDPQFYEFAGEVVPVAREEHLLAVKGGDPVPFTVITTRHGPIANQALWHAADLPPVALRSDVRLGSAIFPSLRRLDRAHDWASFTEALRGWDRPGLNFVYADAAGHIGYHAAGRLPVRPDGDDGRWPVAGWTGEHEWQGEVPFDELPSLFDPPSGFLVTANDRVVDDAYPYTITHDWGDPYRAARLRELLDADPALTLDAAAAIQTDPRSLQADALLPTLLALHPEDPLQADLLGRLAAWDHRFEPDSVPALVYAAWAWKLVPDVLGDELDDADLLADYDPVARIQLDLPSLLERPDDPLFDDRRTPEREDRDAIAARALTEAVDALRERLGDDPDAWTWGALHTVGFQHQPLGQSGIPPLERLFNPPPLPVPGEAFAPNATAWDGVSPPFRVTFGPSQRFLVEAGAWQGARGVTPLGQSGQLFHPHRHDQLSAWADGTSFPMPFGPDAAAEAAAETLTLIPGGDP